MAKRAASAHPTPSTNAPLAIDCPHPVIIGGGPVGMVLALSLQAVGIAVTVIEAQPAGAMYDDHRALALAYGSRVILERLGVWARIAHLVTPIETIHISQQKGLGRTLLRAQDHAMPALGYVVSYGQLLRALDMQMQAMHQDTDAIQNAQTPPLPSCQILTQTAVKDLHVDAHQANIVYQTHAGQTVTCTTPLAIVADGGRSLEAVNGLVRETKHYGHDALVTKVTTQLPHQHIAYERFTPHGPLALLPNGESFSLVWTGEASEIDQLTALDDAAFLAALHQTFGDRVGEFLSCGPRLRFPLKLSKLSQTFLAHAVIIGNAAQTMHPVAGQGFNVGLRDADTLAQCLASTDARHWGSAGMLDQYRQQRKNDTERGLLFTDFLVNVFSNDLIVVGALRGLGLGMLALLPRTRQWLVNKMSYGR